MPNILDNICPIMIMDHNQWSVSWGCRLMYHLSPNQSPECSNPSVERNHIVTKGEKVWYKELIPTKEQLQGHKDNATECTNPEEKYPRINKLRRQPSSQGWERCGYWPWDAEKVLWVAQVITGPRSSDKHETPSQGSGGPELVCGHEVSTPGQSRVWDKNKWIPQKSKWNKHISRQKKKGIHCHKTKLTRTIKGNSSGTRKMIPNRNTEFRKGLRAPEKVNI